MKKTIKVLIIMLILSISIAPIYVENTINVYAATSSLLPPSSSEVDTNELTSDDWALITSSNSNSTENSFDFIKNNTSSNDNGKWILYSGLGLIVLSVIGILYVIFSNITPKKKKINKHFPNNQHKQNQKSRPYRSTNHNQNINHNNSQHQNQQFQKNNDYEEKIKSNRSNSDWDRFFNN